MPNNNLSKSKQKEIKDLIEKGREQGFLTIGEINDLLPTNLYDADQIDGIIKLITDLKIKVVESNKDVDTEVVIGDEEVSDDDDNEITEQEAVEVLSNLDEEFGRTSDPVRMYMREMGTVELLNRAGEIVIAKKIEEGQKLIYAAIQRFPESISFFLKLFKNEEEIDSQISDYILDVKEKSNEEFKSLKQNLVNPEREFLIEETINGREFTVSVLKGRCLAPLEIIPASGMYDYHAKYIAEDTIIQKAQLEPDQIKLLCDIALKACTVCECKDWARVDVMQNEDGKFYVLEINTVPGMTDHSLFPAAAKISGLSFNELIHEIISDA